MKGALKRRVLGTTLAMLAVGLVVAPVSYAGEDETDDSGSAGGGVATGAGGMSFGAGGESVTVELLAGASLLVLSAAGVAVRRRQDV